MEEQGGRVEFWNVEFADTGYWQVQGRDIWKVFVYGALEFKGGAGQRFRVGMPACCLPNCAVLFTE